MKILLVAENDWANMAYRYQESLKEVGVDAKAVTLFVNFSCKPNHAEVCSLDKIKRYAKSADIIQFMHSRYFDLGVKNKRFFVFHGGTAYRRQSNIKNKIFNDIVEKSIIQTGDLLGLGAKNEVWIPACVDTKKIKPSYHKKSRKIIVGHFPSSPRVKSSEKINKVMKQLQERFHNKIQYVYSPATLSWPQHINRLYRCDVYIDACTPILKIPKSPKGNKYGEWGVAAIEAAAMGKVVVSHMLSYKRYEKEFGKCEIRVANSLKELKNQMIKIAKMSDFELIQLKRKTREWVEKYHSYQYMGKRLKEVVYEI